MSSVTTSGVTGGNTRLKIRAQLKEIAVRFGYCTKPAFLIIGAQKAGTSALYSLLNLQKNIKGARKKEINYFDQNIRYQKGRHWYHMQFPLPHHLKSNGLTFEATPEYLYYPQVAQRIYAYNPDILLIVLLRNPVERAYSAWNMFRRFNQEKDRHKYLLSKYDGEVVDELAPLIWGDGFPTFEQAIEDEIERYYSFQARLEPSFVRRGLYDDQIARYLKFFKREQMLIFDSDRLNQKPGELLDEIYKTLGLKKTEDLPSVSIRKNVGEYKSAISERASAVLKEFYHPHNTNLFNILGYEFQWY